MFTINIGLANPVMGGFNTVQNTLTEALNFLDDVSQIRISHDGDEPTVIIDFTSAKLDLKGLAWRLDQDCIAIYDHNVNTGRLIGDKAEQWGEFNPKYFQFTTVREHV